MSREEPAPKFHYASTISNRGLRFEIILLAFVFVVIIFVFSVMAVNIHNSAAVNSVLSRVNQTAERFYAYISRTLVLVQKASRSNAIKSWFADEENEEKKESAYYEMLDYSSVLSNPHLYFGIQDSLGDFSFQPGTTLENFAPYKKLDPEEPWDSWYFECAASDREYVLKFDKDLDTEIWKLWLNHKVMVDSKLAGVFCAAFEIDDLRRELFAGFDTKRERGFVIDEDGVILMSSDDAEYYNRETEAHVTDIYADIDFISMLEETGMDGDSVSPQATALRSRAEPFRYNAVMRIPATNWSVVVFYNSDYLTGIAGMVNFLPLPLALIVSMLLYAVISRIHTSRLVLKPLERLTGSIAKLDTDEMEIYGYERPDEIGDLSRTIRESRGRLTTAFRILREITQDREAQERLLFAVNETAAILLKSPDDEDNFRASILKAMMTIGTHLAIDRVTVWRYKTTDNAARYVPKHEWYNEIYKDQKSVFDSDILNGFDNPEWTEKFTRGECAGGIVKNLTKIEQELFSYNKLKSVLLIPIHLQESLWGFINFGDSRNERAFPDEEINILRSASLMIVNAIEHNIQAAQLNKTRERSRIMLSANPLASVLWNKDFRVFDCNEEAVRMFGAETKSELIERYFDTFPEYQSDGFPSKEAGVKHLQTAFDEGKCTFYWTHQTLTGELVPSEVTIVRIPYKGEYAIAGYTRDLRNKIQMTREIETKDKLLRIVNQAALILLSREEKKFDDAMTKGLGLFAGLADIDRMSVFSNYEGPGGELYLSQLYCWRKADGGTVEIVNELKNIPFSVVFPHLLVILQSGECIGGPVSQLPDNETFKRFDSVTIFAVPVFDDGKFWGVTLFERLTEEDFTEYESDILRSASFMLANAVIRHEEAETIRRANETLAEQAYWYKSLLDGIPIPISVTDNDMNLIFTNTTSVSALGNTNREDLIGKHCSVWDVPICNTPDCSITRARQGFNQTFFKMNGSSFKVESQILKNPAGENIGHLEMLFDITEVENAARREADAENIAKTNFLASMSHEMRTPLNAIMGLSEFALASDHLDDEAQANIIKIHNAGATLVSTVNDILDISKIEAGKLELIPTAYEIPSLINDAITQNVARMEEKPLAFILDIESDLPLRLYGDELRSKEILNNLLSNAFKYTSEGTIELGVRCEREGETMWLIAWVKDTGIGIKQEDIKSLFADYVQVDKKSNRSIQGTGLGLAITKRLVELMSGTITVESEYGKGSVFTVRIKQKYLSDETIGPDMVRNLKNFRYTERKRRKNLHFDFLDMSYARVLAVDDISVNLDVARGMLKPYGMKVDCVLSGQEAVDAIRDEKVKYDAIFMDHMMPGMDGIEAARIIREEIGTEYAKTVPIIALTANAITGNKEKFLQAGFQAFISKPIDISLLDSVLREWVRDEEQEKKINVNGSLVYDLRGGQDRRDRKDRRSGFDRRIFGDNLAGLDLAKGMERFGNNRETYLDVMKSFAAGTKPLLDSIKEPGNIALSDYATIVHGVKGSSRGIGAFTLGDQAEALEHAARKGDSVFVEANNAAFLTAANQLIEGIKEALAGQKKENSKPKKEKPDNETLKRLLTACVDYNMDEADAAIAEIEKWEYEADDGLAAWLKENVDLMNFNEVVEKLNRHGENYVTQPL